MQFQYICVILFGLLALMPLYGYAHSYVETRTHRHSFLDKLFTIKFVIPQKNVEKLDSLLMEVSDPLSPRYGKHWSFEEVRNFFHDSKAAARVEKFVLHEARKHHVHVQIKNSGNYVMAVVPVHFAEKMLSANLKEYRSVNGETVLRSTDYIIPKEIASVVESIEDISSFPPERFGSIKGFGTNGKSKGKLPSNLVTPSLLNSYYNIKSNDAMHTSQAVYESLSEMFSLSDLTTFSEASGVNLDSKMVLFAGDRPNNSSVCTDPAFDGCGESMLDIEYMMSVSKAMTTFYMTQDSDSFTDFLASVSSSKNAPLVFSVSYGMDESDADSITKSFNIEAAKLGLRGITIVVASGDDGVAGSNLRNDTSACRRFSPSFPATSPYVLAVGATQGPESGQSEVACASNTGGVITTGGGFSDAYPVPDYQAAFTSGYLANNIKFPDSKLFNPSGRGFPDVSVLGFNYLVASGGKVHPESGTSASTPVFASMLAIINSRRNSKNLPPVGFVNPALYSFASHQTDIFHDITVGENNCAASHATPNCCPMGFLATAGWDPITGLGSVDFEKLASAFHASL